MLRHVRLNEHGAAIGIESGGKPIHEHFNRVLLNLRSVSIVGGERMPIRNKKEAIELVLHADPIFERADEISKVQPAGRTHAAQHAFWLSSQGHHAFCSTMSKAPR